MDLLPTPAQAALLRQLEAVTADFATPPADSVLALHSPVLDRRILEAGFLEAGDSLTAALIALQLARLPYATEAANAGLVAPALQGPITRPLCLMEEGKSHRPIRYLTPGATVIVLGETQVSSFTATGATPLDALYAYPTATLAGERQNERAQPIAPDELRARWRTALAVEIAGLLQGAIDITVAHVSTRHQFGRPLAIFQALRHRLAEAAVRATSARWLALQAAARFDPAQAALAAHYAQASATTILYDLHQFLGGRGLTLEHPLHLWTYRIKALLSELGGEGESAIAAADLVWRKN